MPDLACAAAAARTTPLAPIRPAISISTRVIRLLTTPILGSEVPGDFSRVNPLALLRARRERPRCRAAEQRDELASSQCWHGLSPPRAAGFTLSLPRRGPAGPWADLNRSESRCLACPHELSRLIALDELRIILALAAADLNQNRRQADAATSHIMLDAIAVLLRREPGCHPFTSIDAQSVSLNTLRVFVFALTPAIRYLKAFLEELVGLRISRARVSLKKVRVFSTCCARGWREWRYVGHVGTGFSHGTLKELDARTLRAARPAPAVWPLQRSASTLPPPAEPQASPRRGHDVGTTPGFNGDTVKALRSDPDECPR